MAKELTREDALKTQYSYLVKINQRMKNICSCYYIHPDGKIYMKSLVDFIEIVGEIRYPEKISNFLGCMILPNKFFEFSKVARKTKLEIVEFEEDGTKIIQFSQGDSNNPEEYVYYRVNIVNPTLEVDYATRIAPEMYRRYTEFGNKEYHYFNDKDVFFSLTDVDIERLLKDPIILDIYGTTVVLTKQLFLDLKKGDNIAIARMCYKKVDSKKRKIYYDIRHVTDLYESHIFFSIIQGF